MDILAENLFGYSLDIGERFEHGSSTIRPQLLKSIRRELLLGFQMMGH